MNEAEKNTKRKNRGKFQFKSIRSYLIVVILMVSLTPLFVVGIVSNLKVQNEMEEVLLSSLVSTEKQLNHSIDNFIVGAEAQLNMLVSNINFTSFYDNELNAQYGKYQLQGTVESRSDYLFAYFASSKKDFIQYPEEDLPDGYDPTERDWYIQAVENKGKMVVGEPYEDEVTKNRIVTLSKAVLDGNEVVGVVGMDLDLEQLSNNTNDVVVGDNGFAFLLSEKGIYITHKDPTLIGTKIDSESSLWKEVSTTKEGVSEFTLKEVKNLSAFSVQEKTGWKVVANVEKSEISHIVNEIKYAVIGLMIAFLFSCIFFSYRIGKRISNNITQIQKSIKIASSGDLTTRVEVTSNDELRRLADDFNHMMDELTTSLENVNESSKTVLDTASTLSVMTNETTESIFQVAQAIEEIAQGTGVQSENVQNSASEISLLSQKLDVISESTKNMNNVSEHSSQLSSKGLEQVVLLGNKSSQTKNSTTEVGEIVREVDRKMEDINKIIVTISQITEQTNLLALNASIEAARAGEAGRGFAVVANEVRNLAEQSKESASEIKHIVESIKAVVKRAVLAMDKTNDFVSEQESAVEEMKKLFTDILHSIDEMNNKSNDVKTLVTESQQSKEKVVSEIESISAVSEQTASSSEEVSASAEEISATMEEFKRYANGLQQLSEQLDIEIKKFKLS